MRHISVFLLGLVLGLAIGIGALARAASPGDDASDLVCQYSNDLCSTLHSVDIQPATHYPGAFQADGWTDGRTIWYVPAAIAIHNPRLTDRAELGLILAKEAATAEAVRRAPFSAATCVQGELPGHQAMVAFWDWLWSDRPPNIVYNDVELTAALDKSTPLGSVLYTCQTLFAPS